MIDNEFGDIRLREPLYVSKQLLTLLFGSIPLGDVEAWLSILQALELFDVRYHELAVLDPLVLTLDRSDAAGAFPPSRQILALRMRYRAAGAGRVLAPGARERGHVVRGATAQGAVDSVARGKVCLRRVLHLLAPRAVLCPNDRPHLVEQVQVALLDLRRPI